MHGSVRRSLWKATAVAKMISVNGSAVTVIMFCSPVSAFCPPGRVSATTKKISSGAGRLAAVPSGAIV